LADIAPFADLDLPAMCERQELAQDAAVAADDDLVGIAADVPNPGVAAERRVGPQAAGRATAQTLDQVIEIHAVSCRQAMARDDAARSSPCPFPVCTSKTVASASASALWRDQPCRE
ncbi:hypothetical protein NS44R_14855, partial [Mammaliicoccus sciuri]